MATAVYLNRPPHSAFLVAWGHHATGWWGCITASLRIAGDNEPVLDLAAWVPAHAVTKPNYVGAVEVPRLELPADRRSWPAPPRWPSWYAGVWADGPLALPAGIEMITGPAWRKKPSRAPA